MPADRWAAWQVPVDVNRASVAELASLDGIGPKLAARIVARRPFASVDEVATVSGIGQRRLTRLRPRLVLDDGGADHVR
jgi:competence ComEA-like helix-hairpin-helix protein